MKTYLETDRLFLREMDASDLPDLCDILQDARVMTAYEGPFTLEQARDWLDRQRARYARDGFGLCAIVRKADGVMVGQAGLTMQDTPQGRLVEIGYLLKYDHWHQGYAAEAAAGLMRHAFDALGVRRIVSIIRDTNLASQAVARRGGLAPAFAFTKHYRGIDMPHTVFERFRDPRAPFPSLPGNAWDVCAPAAPALAEGVWAVGGGLVLKSFPRARTAALFARAASAFREAGLPGARVVPTRAGAPVYEAPDGTAYVLYERLPGEALSGFYAPGGQDKLLLLGDAAAAIHEALRDCASSGFPACDAQDEIRRFSRLPGLEGRVPALMEALLPLYAALPRQVIHRDLHPGNLLFQECRLSGVIDTDHAHVNARLFDICYLALAVLAHEGGEAPDLASWLQLFRAFLRGYEARSPLAAQERAALPGCCVYVELCFLYYFLQIGDDACARVTRRLIDFLLDAQAALAML